MNMRYDKQENINKINHFAYKMCYLSIVVDFFSHQLRHLAQDDCHFVGCLDNSGSSQLFKVFNFKFLIIFQHYRQPRIRRFGRNDIALTPKRGYYFFHIDIDLAARLDFFPFQVTGQDKPDDNDCQCQAGKDIWQIFIHGKKTS